MAIQPDDCKTMADVREGVEQAGEMKLPADKIGEIWDLLVETSIYMSSTNGMTHEPDRVLR